MPDPPRPLAAVDLGSNSFHMVIGRELAGQVSILDRLREPVRLRAGLDERGALDDATVERALECLGRFRQRLVEIPRGRVRAVATHTFRHAKSPRTLIDRCGAALGVPIEVLPGPEEARLVYLGVAQELGHASGRRLVVDIGGGSTECVLGDGSQPLYADSLAMGCVSYSLRFFERGALTSKAFTRARIAARLELEPIRRRYRDTGWQEAVGTSGTIRSVQEILRSSGLGEEGLTPEGLRRLREALVRAGSVEALDLPGLQKDRRAVLAGGLAILEAVFQSFELGSMRTARAALREGVLYDLAGRIRHEDVRDRTIRALSQRYHVDEPHALRVEHTALLLFEQVHEAWALDDDDRQVLCWAARLHEVGLDVAFSGHHKHGAYLLANAAMPGFSQDEQQRLATLVRAHRRKVGPELFAHLPEEARPRHVALAVLLRLAVRLNRARRPRPVENYRLGGRPPALELVFPGGWLEQHTLLRADLEDEAGLLAGIGIALAAR